MSTVTRLTIHDLEGLPQPWDDTRYELIEGELYVSTQPDWEHQFVCLRVQVALSNWDQEGDAGVVLPGPGVIFAVDEAAAPDVVWVSRDRFPRIIREDGKLHAAPDLMVEVLSPGKPNETRDRTLKLAMYSRHGVREYWIVDWRHATLQVYRRQDLQLALVATLGEGDRLESPLLPGFGVAVAELMPPHFSVG